MLKLAHNVKVIPNHSTHTVIDTVKSNNCIEMLKLFEISIEMLKLAPNFKVIPNHNSDTIKSTAVLKC